MIKSIRYFLLISLLVSITIASAINGLGNYLLDEKVVQPYLDSQLERTSAFIDILSKYADINPKARDDFFTILRNSSPITNLHVIFQVWEPNGKLRLSSSNDIPLPLHDAPVGFSDREYNGHEWRLYSQIDPNTKVKIIVAELYNLRRELGDDIAHSNANILLVTYPVFGLLVWFIVSFALRSITRVTSEISNRASTYLEPVQLTEIPIEIQPLIAALNELFIRLKLAFDRNKRFAADAAHELRTPLAALKTHVQVALMAENEAEKNKALNHVIESVDRSSHVVAQLLTLSRLGEEEALTDMKPVDLHKIVTEMMAYLAPHAIEKEIEIELEPAPANAMINGSEIALGILIRNIVDNAIRYTPSHGEVKVAIKHEAGLVILSVTDSGTGIPPELRDRVFERFYRILGSKAPGSGLGLAIVSQIAKLHHAKITLNTPPNGIGLQFDVAFPSHHE